MAPALSEQEMYDLVCKGRFDTLAEQHRSNHELLQKILTVLQGEVTDDEKKPGLMDRVRRLERAERQRQAVAWTGLTGVVGLIVLRVCGWLGMK